MRCRVCLRASSRCSALSIVFRQPWQLQSPQKRPAEKHSQYSFRHCDLRQLQPLPDLGMRAPPVMGREATAAAAVARSATDEPAFAGAAGGTACSSRCASDATSTGNESCRTSRSRAASCAVSSERLASSVSSSSVWLGSDLIAVDGLVSAATVPGGAIEGSPCEKHVGLGLRSRSGSSGDSPTAYFRKGLGWRETGALPRPAPRGEAVGVPSSMWPEPPRRGGQPTVCTLRTPSRPTQAVATGHFLRSRIPDCLVRKRRRETTVEICLPWRRRDRAPQTTASSSRWQGS